MCVDVKIDMEKGEGPEIAGEIRYSGLSVLVLYPDGRISIVYRSGTG